jgi:hypothetical protein
MLRINRAIHAKTSPLLLLSLLVVIVPGLVRGDDLTGLSQNDPKDLMPASPAPAQPTGEISFLQMPGWSRGIIMPPLPDQLKPMGKKPNVAVAPAPAPLAPPKDTPVTPAATETPKPNPTPESPALVTVSPFLQWIKSNPQAAAAQARQQANGYQNPAAPGPGAPGNSPAGPTGNGEDPYWLPPLIDSAGAGPTPVGGSAAIYSTPQR